MDILRELCNSKTIDVIRFFIKNPSEQHCLTEISNKTKVNIATTLRILDKFIDKEFIETVMVGKTRLYQLADNEKTRALKNLL